MTTERTAQSYQSTQEVVGSILFFLRRMASRWPIVMAAAVVAVGVAFWAPKVLRPVYQARATLMYRNTVTPESVLVSRDQRAESWREKSARYSELVFTRANLEQIVQEFGLYPDIVKRQGVTQAAERLRAEITVRVPASGTLLTLSYQSTDREKLLPVINRIEADFKQQPIVDSVEEAKATKTFLEKQYQAAGEELAAKEAALAAFVALHPEFAEPGGAGVGALTRSRQREIDSTGGGRPVGKAALWRQISRIEERLAALDKGSTGVNLAPQTRIVPEDQARIDAAQRVVATAQERLSGLSQQFTEAHPDVQAAKADLNKARAEFASAKANARTETLPDLTAETEKDIPTLRAELTRELTRLRAEAAKDDTARPKTAEGPNSYVDSLVALETEWTSKYRDVENARSQHASIGQRLFQADTVVKLVSLAGTGQIVTLDPAYEPLQPAGRGRFGTMMKAFMAMMILGLLITAAVTALDERVFREQDLKVDSGTGGVVATIPAFEVKKA